MAKQYPKHFKDMVLKEVDEIGSVSQVAKRHDISDKSIYRWIEQAKHKDWKETSTDAKQISSYIPNAKEFKEIEVENDKLKNILGEKDLEIAILRDLLKKTNPLCLKRVK